MRRLLWGALAACSPAPPARVELPAPLPSAAVAVVASRDPVPRHAAPIRSESGGAWARAFPRASTFRSFEPRSSTHILLTWRIGSTHVVERVPGGDYPVNHVSAVDLVVRAGGRDTVVALGELPGSSSPVGLSYCKNLRFRPVDSRWDFPREPSVASAFTIGIMQGSDDYLLVRDGGTLHLLHRESNDGRCDEAKQGPLDVCEGSEYARLAEIHVGRGDLFEAIDDQGTPFDCGADRWGERLLPP
jgi:hypothetical protein